MRTSILVLSIGAGLMLAGAGPVGAMPLGAPGAAVSGLSDTVRVQWHAPERSHWRFGSRAGWAHSATRSHWRWSSRPRCHMRGASTWGRC